MKMMNRIIEYYKPSGVMGGVRGISIDFDNNVVSHWDGRETTIDESISDVIYVLEMNIKETIEKKVNLIKRMKLEETTRVPIENGYKIIEPLNEKQRESYKKRKEELNEYLNLLHELMNKYSNGKGWLQTRVDQLKEEYSNLNFEYTTKFGSDDGSYECEKLLDKMREIETTFRLLGLSL